MHFDIRLPIGTMFSLLGLMLVGYAIGGDPAATHVLAPRAIDAGWGAVMFIFGGLLLVLARRHRRAQHAR
jgi:hypothetical protein